MKNIIVASLLSAMISIPAFAADTKMPLDSARSDVPPNNQKLVNVVERVDLTRPSASKSEKMTVEQLVSNRPTIAASTSGESKLCTVDNSMCVSAKNNPDTLTIATFKYGTGAPKNIRPISRKEFDGRKVAVPAGGVSDMDCHFVNGKNTGNCRIIASSNK